MALPLVTWISSLTCRITGGSVPVPLEVTASLVCLHVRAPRPPGQIKQNSMTKDRHRAKVPRPAASSSRVNKPRVSRAQRSVSPGLKLRTLARLRRKGPCVSGDSSHPALRSPPPQRTRGGPQVPRNSSNAPADEGLQGSWPGWDTWDQPVGVVPLRRRRWWGAASCGACAHRGRVLCTRFPWAVCAPNRERKA